MVQAIALDFASRRRACKLIPSQTASARSSMDRASDYGSEGWGFESLRARSGPPRCDPPVGVLHFCQALLRECFFHAHFVTVTVLASRFPVRSEMTAAQQRAYLSGGATELARRVSFRAPRDIVRPKLPLQWYFREKICPARHKPPIVGHFSCAGRTFSRSRPRSDRAGRTFSPHRTQPRGNCETTITTAAADVGQRETATTTARP